MFHTKQRHCSSTAATTSTTTHTATRPTATASTTSQSTDAPLPGYAAAVDDDGLEQALPKCPRCLVLMDVEGPDELPYLECPQCGDVFL